MYVHINIYMYMCICIIEIQHATCLSACQSSGHHCVLGIY